MEQDKLEEEPKGLRPQRAERKRRVSYERLNRRKQQGLKPFLENHRITDYEEKETLNRCRLYGQYRVAQLCPGKTCSHYKECTDPNKKVNTEG